MNTLASTWAFGKDWLIEVEQKLTQHRMACDNRGRSPLVSSPPTNSRTQLPCHVHVGSLQVRESALLFSCSFEALLRLSINDSKVHQALTQFFRNMVTIGKTGFWICFPLAIAVMREKVNRGHHLTLALLQGLEFFSLAFFRYVQHVLSFFPCSRGRFSFHFPSNQIVLQSQSMQAHVGLNDFLHFQILCRPDLNSTVFV